MHSTMRFVLFLLGLVLGVAGTLAYAMFASAPAAPTVARPIADDAPITVTLGKPFLDALLQRTVLDLPGVGATPTDLHVEFRDGTISVFADIDVLGRSARGETVLKPVLRDGRLRVEVVETNLGAIPLPAIERVIEDRINARVRSLLAGIPVTFTGATVDHVRGVVVACRVDPRALDERTARTP
jgi:uncharacterized protein YpmS